MTMNNKASQSPLSHIDKESVIEDVCILLLNKGYDALWVAKMMGLDTEQITALKQTLKDAA